MSTYVAVKSWSFYLLQRVFNSFLEILPVQQQRIALWNSLVKISLLVLLHQERVCLQNRGAHSQDFGGFLHLVRKVYTINMIFTSMTTSSYFIFIVTWSGEHPSLTASPCVRTLRRQTRVDRVAGTFTASLLDKLLAPSSSLFRRTCCKERLFGYVQDFMKNVD